VNETTHKGIPAWGCALLLIPAAYGTWRFLGHSGSDLGSPLEWLAVALLPICLGRLLRGVFAGVKRGTGPGAGPRD